MVFVSVTYSIFEKHFERYFLSLFSFILQCFCVGELALDKASLLANTSFTVSFAMLVDLTNPGDTVVAFPSSTSEGPENAIDDNTNTDRPYKEIEDEL